MDRPNVRRNKLIQLANRHRGKYSSSEDFWTAYTKAVIELFRPLNLHINHLEDEITNLKAIIEAERVINAELTEGIKRISNDNQSVINQSNARKEPHETNVSDQISHNSSECSHDNSNGSPTKFNIDLDILLNDFRDWSEEYGEADVDFDYSVATGLLYEKFIKKYEPKNNQTLFSEKEIYDCILDSFTEGVESVYIGEFLMPKDCIGDIARVLADKLPKQQKLPLVSKDEIAGKLLNNLNWSILQKEGSASLAYAKVAKILADKIPKQADSDLLKVIELRNEELAKLEKKFTELRAILGNDFSVDLIEQVSELCEKNGDLIAENEELKEIFEDLEERANETMKYRTALIQLGMGKLGKIEIGEDDVLDFTNFKRVDETKMVEIDQLRGENNFLEEKLELKTLDYYAKCEDIYEIHRGNISKISVLDPETGNASTLDFSNFKHVEKVKIPRFVAEYIEYCKESYINLNKALRYTDFLMQVNVDYTNKKLKEKLDKFERKDFNSEIFARAWLDGYEVEEEKPREKRYYVLFREFSRFLGKTPLSELDKELYFDTENAETYTKSELTELMDGALYKQAETKVDDDTFWARQNFRWNHEIKLWEWINPLIELVEVKECQI